MGIKTDSLRQQIYQSMDLKDTDELLEIWEANDRNDWSDDAFDVIKELLQNRNVEIPEQQIKNSSARLEGNKFSSKVENKEIAKKHFDQSYEYWEKSKYEEALEECDKAIELAPDWSEAHNLRGVILEEMDKPDKSILEYREAVRLDPDNKDAKENLGQSQVVKKEPKNPWIEALSTGAMAGVGAGAAAHFFAGGKLTYPIWILAYVLVIANVKNKLAASIAFVVVASLVTVILE